LTVGPRFSGVDHGSCRCRRRDTNRSNWAAFARRPEDHFEPVRADRRPIVLVGTVQFRQIDGFAPRAVAPQAGDVEIEPGRAESVGAVAGEVQLGAERAVDEVSGHVEARAVDRGWEGLGGLPRVVPRRPPPRHEDVEATRAERAEQQQTTVRRERRPGIGGVRVEVPQADGASHGRSIAARRDTYRSGFDAAFPRAEWK
jgi:hypothetical protein